MKNTNSGEHNAATVGHAHGSLAEVLYQPLPEKEIKMTLRVSGQSRSAPEGVWVQELREKLINSSRPLTTQSRKTSGAHPCRT